MKIAMIGQKAIPFHSGGGIETHVEEISTRLSKSGNEVVVYVRSKYVATQDDIWNEIKLIRIFSIPTKHLETITYTIFATIHSIFSGFDIIHYHGVGPALIAWIPRLFTRAKIVVTFHSIDRFHRKWGPISRLALRMGEWSAVHFPHETIAVSKSIQTYCKKKFNKNVIYIPNGVSIHKSEGIKKLKQWNLKKDSYILTVARLVKHKGIHHLIKAYKLIPNSLKEELKLVIVGASSFTKDYDKYLKELASEDHRIIFTGYQTAETLGELYTNAYLYVHPSEYEGLSVTILEAMSYGRCVIVSDIPENKEVIDHSGISFKVGDIEDLAEKITELVNHPEIVKERGKIAPGFMKAHYSWEEIVKKTEKLYKKISK